MAVEAELTARVPDPNGLRATLSEKATPEYSTYADVYWDRPDRSLDREGYELRIRTITTGHDRRILLTYKEPAVHESGSKPEHETTVADAQALSTIFAGLGLVELISFEKRCENYRFTEHDRELLATVVTIPELGGETFLELETMAEPDDLPAALETVQSVLHTLGIPDKCLTTTSYTDRVEAARAQP